MILKRILDIIIKHRFGFTAGQLDWLLKDREAMVMEQYRKDIVKSRNCRIRKGIE